MLTLTFVSIAFPTRAVEQRGDLPLTPALRDEVIAGMNEKILAGYFDFAVATRITADIEARRRRGEFAALGSAASLCDRLNELLKSESRDAHLEVGYFVKPRPMTGPITAIDHPQTESAEARNLRRADEAWTNHGFRQAVRLRGNIGYLEIERFFKPDEAGETAAAALTFLADTDAMIIDLRGNGGGTPQMVAFIASYLLDEPTHLNSIQHRDPDDTAQIWSLPFVPGRRFGGKKPLFILTGGKTFSAAEEFAYDLQSLKRAVVVGARTRGGANPGGFKMINPHFAVIVPTGRSVNPVTLSNWEGTGITPDVAQPEEQAKARAYVEALLAVAKRAAPDRKTDYEELIAAARLELVQAVEPSAKNK